MARLLDDRWVSLLGADPRPWLVASEEAPARWVTLTNLISVPADDERASPDRAAAVASPMVQGLIDRLPTWGVDTPSGHQSPAYLPNMLHLLADLGVRAGDDSRVERCLDDLEAHQADDGRFLAFGRAPKHPEPVWGSLPCDTHIITEALLRFGRGGAAISRGLDRIGADLGPTSQGPAWTCIPDPAVGFRGPGRKGDLCPQVTLEALRLFSRIPDSDRPDGLDAAAETLLVVWRRRGSEQPYMFGHGSRFKKVKWPPFWYGAYWMLDTLGRYPVLWREGKAANRRSLAELVACLIAYNVSPDGKVTPRSVYRGFEDFSFGQKRRPSPIATALLLTVLRRFSGLSDEVSAVDVSTLASSRGGSGRPVLPVS